VTSGLAGLIPSNCSAIAIAMALLCLAALVAGVVVRPYNTPVKNHLMNMGSLFTFVAAVLIVVAVHHEDPATAKGYAQTGARLAIGATYFGVVSSVITIARFVLMRYTRSAMVALAPDPNGVQAALISTDVVELMDMASQAPVLAAAFQERKLAEGSYAAPDVEVAAVDVEIVLASDNDDNDDDDDDDDVESLDLDRDVASHDDAANVVVGAPADGTAAAPAPSTMTDAEAELLFGAPRSAIDTTVDAAAAPAASTMTDAEAELLFRAPRSATDTPEREVPTRGASSRVPPAVQYDEHGQAVVDEGAVLRTAIEDMKRPDAFARFVGAH
jgi:hypothetical protein